ncbi:MAG: hypothetical protein K2N25_08120 [Muribaculaceae bacterium]|nr:hypothetical protein [Muribaculaceae bacterium]
MKKHYFLAASLLMASMGAFNVSAQRDNRHMESGVTTLIHNEDANPDDVEKTMKGNAPKAPNDNGLPRFAIVGKNNDFYLGIGGQFLGEGVFTWGDNMPSATLFTPSALTPKKTGNGGNTQFAWQTSSLYMNFVAMPGSDNQIGIFFKGHFMGKDDSFKLQHFYAKYRGLTAGFTHSLFTDGAAEPMTIDFEGPNGYPFLSLFTAYWEQNFTKNFSGAIGIDAPTASMTTGSTTETVNQRIPAIPLYLQYAWNDGAAHIRLSGLIRPLQYRNLSEGANKTEVGGGIQLSGMTKVAGDLSANFNAAYGRGIGTYLQDDNGLGMDAVATSEPGHMKTVKTFGVTGGLSYRFSPKVSSNITYSHLVNSLPDDAAVSDSQYRYGDYVAANVIYNINKFVSAGIEYDYGHRKDFNGEGLHANRLQCQLAVTF